MTMANPTPPIEELRACPFCGKFDAFIERADCSSCYVLCNNCSARGPVSCDETEADADASEHGDVEPGELAARRLWDALPDFLSAETALAAQSVSDEGAFQAGVAAWMQECFGPEISADKVERNDRFVEESLELVQSLGYTAERAHALVDYVFGRPVGEPKQEVGGVGVTLAALCIPNDLNMADAFQCELDRIRQPEIVAKIRAKQAAKPTGSALPIAHPIKPVEAVERMREEKHAHLFCPMCGEQGHVGWNCPLWGKEPDCVPRATLRKIDPQSEVKK